MSPLFRITSINHEWLHFDSIQDAVSYTESTIPGDLVMITRHEEVGSDALDGIYHFELMELLIQAFYPNVKAHDLELIQSERTMDSIKENFKEEVV